ncbi:hypothetical protein Glove_242g221 [Diversispora epigaea]|uniref:Uncharacterized protein n=1 Tax=Diversispora epigaea TaxID=1348612 RepID=A0A397IHC5_9GLOM|nr:hypothetical protein Glove_242g221 [Diversispora epigaea]
MEGNGVPCRGLKFPLRLYVLPKSQIIWDLGRQNAQITSIWDLGFGILAKNTNYNLGFGIWDFGIWDFSIWISNLGGSTVDQKQSDGETLYSEQYSGNWWKNAKASIRPEAHILSIILYSDATTTDSLGKSSLHPIYISLGNIRTWRRNKEDAKQLLGYLPILSANNEGQTSKFKRLARETFHNSLKFLLDPLFDEDGIDFKINNKNIWFFPRISTVIGDWPEACTFSLTFKSANSNYPCHFCQTHRNNLTSIRKDCIIIRNKENMQEYYNNGSAESIGLEQVYNYFWTIP